MPRITPAGRREDETGSQAPGAEGHRPTLRDVAQETGLAVSTVSMAMRGDPAIAEATRRTVEEAAARLNYCPHPMLSALMQTRSTRRDLPATLPIAFLSLFSRPEPWKHGWIIPDLHTGMITRCASRGYHLEELWTKENGVTERRVDEILIARGITGLVVGPSPAHHSRVHLSWDRFCAVTIGYSISNPVLDRVISHHVHGVQIAFRELRRRRYKRIGLAMLARENARVDWQWSAGYLSGALWRSLELCPPFLAKPSQWNGPHFLRWFREHRPDAILCVHSERIIPWLEEADVRIPEDVGLVDLYYREEFGERIATIDQNVRQIGESVVDILLDKMHRNQRGVPVVPRTLLVEPRWRDGNSVR